MSEPPKGPNPFFGKPPAELQRLCNEYAAKILAPPRRTKVGDEIYFLLLACGCEFRKQAEAEREKVHPFESYGKGAK